MTIKITTLDNGLRVATNSFSGVETAALGVWVGVGARNEPENINGISHVLEHMAFKGTEKRNAKDIAEAVENVGGHLNAYTSRENTAYYARVLKQDVPLALDIIGDILTNSTFDESELSREKGVIVQEIGQSLDTPDDIIFDYFQETAFKEQSLGRPILGSVAHVESFTPHQLNNYLKTNYKTQRMVLSASGNVDHDEVVDLANKHFASFEKESSLYKEKAAYSGGDFRQDRDLEQAHIILGFEGVANTSDDFQKAIVLSTLLGGGMSSRLFQEVREKRGLVYSIYSYNASYSDTGLFAIYAGTSPEKVDELVPVVLTELENVSKNIELSELNRAKAQLKAGTLMGLESTSSKCEQLAQHMLVFGRPISFQEIIEKIDAVNIDDLQFFAKKLFGQKKSFSLLAPLEKINHFHV